VNIQEKKPPKAEPDEEGSVHLYVVVGYNYIRAIPYEVEAVNGKIN
jgi:hypothetical protein